MEYKVIMTKRLFGEILVQAQDKDEAVQKAYEIAKNNEYKWYSEEKIDAHEVHQVPIMCNNCNATLPPESLFCNKCGTKIEGK